jgi:para-aminobenzoate synthetase/4-amino-4-deoxychorismate lyase
LVSAPFYIFENTKAPSDENSFSFAGACHEILATEVSEIPKCFREIEKLSRQGYFLAGFVSYEAGTHFLDVNSSKNINFPLIHFHAFKEKTFLPPGSKTAESFTLTNFQRDISYQQYLDAYNIVQNHLRRGDTYQVNLSLRESFNGPEDSFHLYHSLKESQRVPYATYISLKDFDLLSFSPELFLKKEGNSLFSLPMKGTSEVSSSSSNIDLINDPKSISENTMIVDLIRNDLSLIAKRGSVKAHRLCVLEEYETLNQMISEVRCELEDNVSIYEIFKALFPCGSITGAPKKSTMEIIDKVESSERGIYTGAIGYIEPNGNFQFNVAIRTLVGDKKGKYTYGLGSGVLADSEPRSEHKEIWLKSKFIKKLNSDFYLFTTMHFENGTFRNLEEHLSRLQDSADYFGFFYNVSEIETGLSSLGISSKKQKCKLILNYDGKIKIELSDLQKDNALKVISLSDIRVSSRDIFLQHKTSKRTVYDAEYALAISSDFYDVVFFNELGHLTEASRHNIFIKIGDTWRTPRLKSGLLSGIQRAKTMIEFKAVESDLMHKDLLSADEIILTNSVRGNVKVGLNPR